MLIRLALVARSFQHSSWWWLRNSLDTSRIPSQSRSVLMAKAKKHKKCIKIRNSDEKNVRQLNLFHHKLSSKMPWCLPLNFILLSSRVLAYFPFIFCRRLWRTHTLRFIGRLSLSIYIFCFSAIREKITKKMGNFMC